MAATTARWLLLSYRLPREPTRLRLAVWRRLKRVGAVPLHGAVWTVPLDVKTREDFEWLAEEVEEAGGSVFVWEADSLDAAQNRRITDRLMREAENRYAASAAAARALQQEAARLSEGDVDRLGAVLRRARRLERELRLDRRRDFVRAPGRARAHSAIAITLNAIRARLDKHAVGDAATLSR